MRYLRHLPIIVAVLILVFMATGCSLVDPDRQSRIDRHYEAIERGEITADEASRRDREPPVDWSEIVYAVLAVLGVGGPLSYGVAKGVAGSLDQRRDLKRRARGEPVSVPKDQL